jgi:hypothetical protein
VTGSNVYAFPAGPVSGAIGSPVTVEFTPIVIPPWYASTDSSGVPTHKDFYIILWTVCTSLYMKHGTNPDGTYPLVRSAEARRSPVHVTYTCEKYDPSVLKQKCAYVTPDQ